MVRVIVESIHEDKPVYFLRCRVTGCYRQTSLYLDSLESLRLLAKDHVSLNPNHLVDILTEVPDGTLEPEDR